MSLRLITFDLDHTLWNPDDALLRGEAESHRWLAAQVPAFAERFPPADFIALRSQLRETQPALRHRVSEIRRIAFRQALTQCGVPGDEIEALVTGAFAVFWECRQQVDLFPDTVPLLEALSRRYRLGALSNGNASLTAIGLAHHFDFHFAGEDFPAAKPAPDMFLAALARAGVSAHEALHIGDHPVDDIAGASAVGMRTLWFNAAGAPWPDHLSPPDHLVTSLPAIPNWLAANFPEFPLSEPAA